MAKQPENQQASPAATQLREAFDEIQTLKADLQKSIENEESLKRKTIQLVTERDLAIARIVLLEQNGATTGLVASAGKDGSLTIPITIDADLVPSLRAQYEGMGEIGVSFEEFVKVQIIGEALSMFQGNIA